MAYMVIDLMEFVLQNYDGNTVESLNIAAGASIRVVFTYGGVGDDIRF